MAWLSFPANNLIQGENILKIWAVGPLQIRKALRATEQLSLVQEYMATASEEVKEAWDYASVFERTDSTVLEVQQVLNVSDDELDSLFELAATF